MEEKPFKKFNRFLKKDIPEEQDDIRKYLRLWVKHKDKSLEELQKTRQELADANRSKTYPERAVLSRMIEKKEAEEKAREKTDAEKETERVKALAERLKITEDEVKALEEKIKAFEKTDSVHDSTRGPAARGLLGVLSKLPTETLKEIVADEKLAPTLRWGAAAQLNEKMPEGSGNVVEFDRFKFDYQRFQRLSSLPITKDNSTVQALNGTNTVAPIHPNPNLYRPPDRSPANTAAFVNAINKCTSCHASNSTADSLKNPFTLIPQIKHMSWDRLQTMVNQANLTPEERRSVEDHFRQVNAPQQYFMSVNDSIPQRSARQVNACYNSQSDRDRRAASLPQAEGSFGAERLNAARGGGMLFYDRTSVPKVWQNAGINNRPTTLMTARNAVNSHMYGLMGYHSDGAREFPWQNTAGLDISPNGSADKFIIPPASGPIANLRMRYKRTDRSYFGASSNVNGPQLGWNFNPDTTMGEVLKVQDPQTGEGIPFEIRLRTKLSTGNWQMDVLRPFANPIELMSAVQNMCSSDNAPPGCQQLSQGTLQQLGYPNASVQSRANYINATNFRTRRNPLRLSRTAAEATQPYATVQELPDLPPDIVRKLLKETPFKSVFGQPWISAQAGKPAGWAPTTKSNFNIVPKNYFAAYIPMTQDGCMKCHDSAGRHVDNFDPHPSQMFASAPGDARRSRTWYNFIPGNDGILSFHPFSVPAVANGAIANSRALNQCLIANGLIR